MDLAPGHRLDRYELICPVAKGGMANVWVARQQGKYGFERLVALKTILPQFAAEERFQQMFLDEARIACAIVHPNVVQTFDLGDDNGTFFIAMEWIEGDPLSKLVRAQRQPLPLGASLRILADACGGLHAAHELSGRDGAPLGVVHRDVSPQNLFVSTQGVTKVIDFGVAKAKNRHAESTHTGILKGKPQFMAPEQALGLDVDRGADVWAIGAILYWLLKGSPPYEADNQLALLHALTRGAPYPPLPPGVPSSVAAIVARALQHDRAARYATCADLQRDLEAAIPRAEDVGALVRSRLHKRLQARKEAIELGLAAASARAEVASRLELSMTEMATTTPPRVAREPIASTKIGLGPPWEREDAPRASFVEAAQPAADVAAPEDALDAPAVGATASSRATPWLTVTAAALVGAVVTGAWLTRAQTTAPEAPRASHGASAVAGPAVASAAGSLSLPSNAPSPPSGSAPTSAPVPAGASTHASSSAAPTRATGAVPHTKKPPPGTPTAAQGSDDLGF